MTSPCRELRAPTAGAASHRASTLLRRPHLWLALAATAAYLPTLFDPLFADDYYHLARLVDALGAPGGAVRWLARAFVLDLGAVGAWWTPPGLAVRYLRPLVAASFLVDHALWGVRAAGYHLTNLALHLATTLVVLRVARRLLADERAAFAAAALFAIHPAHAAAVAWVSGRTDLLATLPFTGALALHLDERDDPRGGPQLARRAGGLVLFLLALAAKEMAITLPAVLLLDELLRPRAPVASAAPSPAAAFARRFAQPLLTAALGLAWVAARARVLGPASLPPHPFLHLPGDPDALLRLLAAPVVYLADLVLFVPAEPSVTFPLYADHPSLVAGLALVTAVTLAGTWRGAAAAPRVRALALASCAVTLAPVLPVSAAEHFLYLPSVGYCVLVGAGVPAALALPRAGRRLALVAVVVGLGVVGRVVGFGMLARGARRPVDEAVARLDAAPDARAAAVVDLPASALLGFVSALRLERPRVTVTVVTTTPSPLRAADGRSRLSLAGDHLRVEAIGAPYLASYLEEALLGDGPPPRTGARFTTPAAAITVVDADAPSRTVRAVDVALRPAALLLRYDAGRLLPAR